MSEWKEYTVQELVEKGMIEAPMDGNHGGKHPKSSDYVKSGVPFIMANDLVGGSIDYDHCSFISEEQAHTLVKGFAKPGDVLLTHKATIGRTALVPNIFETIVLTPQVTYYRIIKGIDNKYLKYYFDTPVFQSLFSNWASSGSTRAYLGITAQHKLPIVLPDIKTQVNISSILSSLDDKIAVNRRICENLEAQAQALFKNWFVDFAPFKNGKFVESELGMIPEGLIYKRIEDMPHTLETGKRPAGGVKGIDNGVPSIGAENIKGLGCYDFSKTKFVTKEFAASMRRGIIKGYELLIYKDGGKPGYFIPNFAIFGEGYPYDEMCLNEHVFRLDFGNKGYSLFAYFFFKTNQIMSYLNAQGAKAAIPGINSKDIDAILMPSLENESVKNYCNNVEGIITQILVLSKESARLATLRDTLLPKLMSGEMKV